MKLTTAVWLLMSVTSYHRLACQVTMQKKKPHIFFILIDDLGYNEVGFRNPEFRTPTINKLASEGVVLNHLYAHPSCTMTRAALMTGRYPHTMGIEKVFDAHDNRSVPLKFKLLPQYLKDQGYQTHAIGKWHLGMCDWSMVPTRRGFDTFYGCLHGNSDHYFKFPVEPFDFWFNETLDHSVRGEYDTEVLSKRAVNIIESHKRSGTTKPLFVYLAYKAVHSPIKVPYTYSNRCFHIKDNLIRDRCGMMIAVDDGIKNIFDSLERVGYLDEPFLLVVMSDNGGSTPHGASNWPLRGKKATPFEGGTRVVGFLHSRSLLPSAPGIYDGLFHVTNWLPTLVKLTNNSNVLADFASMDGKDQWLPIQLNQPSRRDRLVYELWEEEAGVRINNMKIVYHESGPCSGWYNPPPGVNTTLPEEVTDCTGFMLFDLDSDPNEVNDLSQDPRYAQDMAQLLDFYNAEMTRRMAPQSYVINPHKPPAGANWQPGWCRRG